MAYQIARFIIRLLVNVLARVKTVGFEHLPPTDQAYVIASNHLGRLDPVLVYYLLERRDVALIVAEKYQKRWIWRWFVRTLNATFVDRFNADLAAVRFCLKRLKQGGVLALAPEGTRSPTGALIEGKPGTSYLAARAGVPIVPVGLEGTEDSNILGGFWRLRRGAVTVRMGKPFLLPPLPVKDREVALQQATDEIMCQIAAMLPPETRGVYANHPRLLELLAQAMDENNIPSE